MSHRILQIGSGSMGTRRMRDLSRHKDIALALFDSRADRRERAKQRFGIETFENLDAALRWGPDSLCISTPPDHHQAYIEIALGAGLNFFSEADIWTYDFLRIGDGTTCRGTVAAPSCTLLFLPLVQEMQRIVREELGLLSAYSMCLSVDAPGWHPGEGQEYYARHRATAPGREMVPFELIGLSHIFGPPVEVSGSVRRTGDLAAAEDTWCLQLHTATGAVGQLAVLMASPQTMRRGWAGGSHGFVVFDLISGDIERHLPALGIEDKRNFGALSEILEDVYAAEISAFVAAVRGEAEWPFGYPQSSLVTGTLAAAERSSVSGRLETVDPNVMPASLPDQYPG